MNNIGIDTNVDVEVSNETLMRIAFTALFIIVAYFTMKNLFVK